MKRAIFTMAGLVLLVGCFLLLRAPSASGKGNFKASSSQHQFPLVDRLVTLSALQAAKQREKEESQERNGKKRDTDKQVRIVKGNAVVATELLQGGITCEFKCSNGDNWTMFCGGGDTAADCCKIVRDKGCVSPSVFTSGKCDQTTC